MNNAQRVREEKVSLLDIFSGADGGIGYIKFSLFVDEIANRADNGDVAAQSILDAVFYSFCKMVKLAAEGRKNDPR